MIERQFAFTAQNHRAQRPVNIQQPRKVRRAHAVRVQQVSQCFQNGDFGRVELRLFVSSITGKAGRSPPGLSVSWCPAIASVISEAFWNSTSSWRGRGVRIRQSPA